MSESAVARNARVFILEHDFDRATVRALRAVLDAARPGPLQTFWELAADAGHSLEQTRKLCTGLYLLFAWGNLSDDLADGDCDYLDDPARLGPVISFLLRCLADEYLLQMAAVPPTILARAYQLLATAAGLGVKELYTHRWDAHRWREVAEGIAGMQYQAYLQMLWYGTRLAALGEDVGYKLGVVAQLNQDLIDRDERFLSMDEDAQRASESWITTQEQSLAEIAQANAIPSLAQLLRHLDWRQQYVDRR